MPITAASRQIEVLIAVNAQALHERVRGGATASTATFLSPEQANEYIVMMAPRPFMTNASAAMQIAVSHATVTASASHHRRISMIRSDVGKNTFSIADISRIHPAGRP